MTAKLYGFDRSFLHDTTERDPFVIDMVRADDYLKLEAQVAALQEQVRALAAENVALNLALEPQEVPDELQDLLNDTAKLGIDSEGGLDSDSASGQSWVWVENPDEVIRTVLSAIKPETPATDAALREIRADGAMACGVHLREWYDYQVEERAEEFAARIRSGEQP